MRAVRNVEKDSRSELFGQLAEYEHHQDRSGLAQICFKIGVCSREKGDLDTAEIHLRRALVLHEALGNVESVSTCFVELGSVFEVRGDLGQALFYFEEALSRFEASGNERGTADVLGDIGVVQQQLGQLDEAEASHRRALKLHCRLEESVGKAVDYGNLAAVMFAADRMAEAETMHRKALDLFTRHGDEAGVAGQLRCLAAVARRNGQPEVARKLYRQALEHASCAEYRIGRALARAGLADLMVQEEDNPEAEVLYLQALNEVLECGHQPVAAGLHSALGEFYLRQRDYESSCTQFELALEIWDNLMRVRACAVTCKRLGDVYLRLEPENDAKAEQMYRRAKQAFDEVSDPGGSGAACVGLGRIAAQRGEASQTVAMWTMGAELLRQAAKPEAAQQIEAAVRSLWRQGASRVA